MKFLSILLVFFFFECSSNPTKNDKLVRALLDNTIPIKGHIVKISNAEFRLDYYDVYEKGSSVKLLEKLKYQGGGESWVGIIYGAIKLSDPSLLKDVRFDPEADGVAIWSNKYGILEKIGRLLSVIKSDEKILMECIKVAEKNSQME
jgi:Immunity protein 51